MRIKTAAKTIVVAIAVVGTSFVAAANLRPIPPVEGRAFPKTYLASQPADLPWPKFGQSAIGVSGYGVVAKDGDEKPVPIASIAKVITAMAVLEKRPIAAGQTGPDIVITKADLKLFEDYFAVGGSVVKVTEGQKLTQKEALQAMLLPSGNNIADTLAVWAFGSIDAYENYANNMVGSMGLRNTKVADASGFSPKTVSTAEDLARLAEAAMSNTALAGIVGQKEASLNGNKLRNVNWLLGTDGVNGIKTGNTDEAGGCFMFSATRIVEGEEIRVVGAVLGAPTRDEAISASQTLIKTADSGFSKELLIKSGEPLGTYLTPWGDSTAAVASGDIELLVWRGLTPTLETRLETLSGQAQDGTNVGTSSVVVGEKEKTINVELEEDLARPSWIWRALQY